MGFRAAPIFDYMMFMTQLLDKAIEIARALPERAQDEIARLILAAAQDGDPAIALSPEEEATFDESIAQEERGEFVAAAEVRDFWAKLGA